MTVIALADRALLVVSGADAETFLQAIITTDLGQVAPGEAHDGALLTPQGKILFAFLVSRADDGFVLETRAEEAAALQKRLTLYRLRAAVTLDLQSPAPVAVSTEPGAGLRDMRFAKAGITLWRIHGEAAADAPADPTAYTALRIRAGLAEPGDDFALQDAFPHDVLMDRTGGLSFRKGCYVGQEVVSRMQHRGTARRRVALVAGDGADLPAPGTALTADGRAVGTLGSVAGGAGLAIVRIDKAGEAIAAGTAILAGETPVTLALAPWTGLDFPTSAAEAGA
ncbi:CAF17-like 4Fe-4S cluster assembly/insertion protein YgfZ [Ensifer soli]|uniref:CAF17-like 4Fe-4S cluster assembly/insertion protein YgfZ n=1 Tax=Ciceribacter sp. sgz301302 TaxID=3342379 RepID=UPI0035B939E8